MDCSFLWPRGFVRQLSLLGAFDTKRVATRKEGSAG